MTDDTRKLGVEMGTLRERLEDRAFPLSHDDLLDDLGDLELEFGDETGTLESIIGPLNEAVYQSASEVERAVMTMVGDEAIGRKNYSDRTPYAPGEERQKDNPSGDDLEGEAESF